MPFAPFNCLAYRQQEGKSSLLSQINPTRMLNERIHSLITRYFRGLCTPEEKKELSEWILHAADDEDLATELASAWEGYQPDQTAYLLGKDPLERIKIRLIQEIESDDRHPLRAVSHRKPRRWILYSAAAVLVLAVAAYFFLASYKSSFRPNDAPRTADIAPGGNHAILTLANGRSIRLEKAQRGQLAAQGNERVIKVDSGLLAFQSSDKAIPPSSASTATNTLTTPRGGQYSLLLPDGTRVWLNAASSIKFPTAFGDKERKVTITGEAYFTVSHDARRPFIVEAGNQTITDLGTEFNVNLYKDDDSATITTLVEGAIRVTGPDRSFSKNPLPGQQVRSDNHGVLHLVENADVKDVVAWKNGYFSFDKADLKTIMNQLARWYDIAVRYEGDIPVKNFGGEIQRSLSLSEVLGIMEQSGLHFSLVGREVIISP